MNIEIKKIPTWEVKKRFGEVLYPEMAVSCVPDDTSLVNTVLHIFTCIPIIRNDVKYILPYRFKWVFYGSIDDRMRQYCDLLVRTHKEINDIKEKYVIFDAEDIIPPQATEKGLYDIIIYKVI